MCALFSADSWWRIRLQWSSEGLLMTWRSWRDCKYHLGFYINKLHTHTHAHTLLNLNFKWKFHPSTSVLVMTLTVQSQTSCVKAVALPCQSIDVGWFWEGTMWAGSVFLLAFPDRNALSGICGLERPTAPQSWLIWTAPGLLDGL